MRQDNDRIIIRVMMKMEQSCVKYVATTSVSFPFFFETSASFPCVGVFPVINKQGILPAPVYGCYAFFN
jgi:hypothetical protein